MVFGPMVVAEHKDATNGFQFPVGIRWCSDSLTTGLFMSVSLAFNSLWELDGVRTEQGAVRVHGDPELSIPCGN